MTSHPLVISHRTNMGSQPENSLAGIDAALADGADGVEVDVRASSDGVPVLMHDRSLVRTTANDRPVAEVPSAELRDLRVHDPYDAADPQPIPTLEQALERVAGRALLVVEVKQPGIETAVAQVLRASGQLERCWLWSFDLDVCRAYRRVLPEVPIALLVAAGERTASARLPELRLASDAELAAVSLGHPLVGTATVEAAHGLGLQVYAWTVNDLDEIDCVRAAGVDAIVGDHPRRIRRARRAD